LVSAIYNRSHAQQRARAARLLARVAAAIVLLTVALLSAMFGLIVSLRSVDDAQRRVDQILARHDGMYGHLPLPTKLADAVVAVEDEHFYSNVLVNVLDGAGRAALASLNASEDPGGSTIAQQLAKQLYGQGSGFASTLREIALGVKLSLTYSKQQILDMYLNVVYYGNGYWRDVAAARGYFGTAPRKLDWAQAAMLAGLPQAPSAYDPIRHFALAKLRQRHVLSQLVVNHFLTPAQASTAFRESIDLHR